MDPTLWTVRLSAACYAIFLWRGGNRAFWTAGCLLFLAHVVSAFQFHHHWSHDAAYAETARQTAALFGMHWGGGLYFNYLFTALWTFDAAWWWISEQGRASCAKWISVCIQGFLAFMFFNGAVVFPQGPVRWISLIATFALAIRLYLLSGKR